MQISGGLSIDGNPAGIFTGAIQIWAHGYANIPVGWLVLEGQAISRTTYSTLFAIIGTQFGAGDGSTTFNIPDFRGRVPVGHNSGDANFNSVGKKGGAATHTLSVAETPSHNHTATTSWAGDHNHNFRGWRLSNNSGGVQVRSREDIPGDGWDGGNDDTQGGHSHTLTTSSVGSTSAHNNLSPYIAMLWIIKY